MRPGEAEFVLAYGRPVPAGERVRVIVGVTALVVFLLAFVVGLRADPAPGGGGQAVFELVALICVAVAGWALPGAVRRQLTARDDDGAGPVLRLNRDGLEFRARPGGDIVVFAPWELVERCEFRPAPGGGPRWCVDAPIALPSSLSFAAAWAGLVPPSQIEDRVGELTTAWSTLGTPADRALLRDCLLFGTPIVVDLTRCPGVSVPQLDAAVRAWTFGRCVCDPSARPARWPRPDAGRRPAPPPDQSPPDQSPPDQSPPDQSPPAG